MATANASRISPCLLAVILLGATLTRAVAKDVNSTEARSEDVNAIDTSITVQPRRPIGRPDKVRELKNIIKSTAPRNFSARRKTAPRGISHVARNAIGVSVVRHPDLRRRDGDIYGAASVAAVTAAGVDRNMPNGLAKADDNVGTSAGTSVGKSVVQPNTVPTVKTAALNRGMINATRPLRPGFAPSVIGGPTRTVPGISGTMIRPKY